MLTPRISSFFALVAGTILSTSLFRRGPGHAGPGRRAQTDGAGGGLAAGESPKWALNLWHPAAFYTGVMALAEISPSARFHDAMMKMGETNGWKLAARPYHGDDHAVGQTYAELYFKHKDPKMIAGLQAGLDYVLAHPMDDNLAFVGKQKNDRWAWCDVLFMAPPAWLRLAVATGNSNMHGLYGRALVEDLGLPLRQGRAPVLPRQHVFREDRGERESVLGPG